MNPTILFALLMMVVGLLMFRGRQSQGDAGAECTRHNAPKVVGYGAATGALSGFFGIGGGFLIVPALMASTRIQILNAIGSSPIAVCAFGLATALSYALSGYVDWPLAIIFIVGGVGGARIGFATVERTATGKGSLKAAFAILIFVVAACMIALSGVGYDGRPKQPLNVSPASSPLDESA